MWQLTLYVAIYIVGKINKNIKMSMETEVMITNPLINDPMD